MKSLLVQSASLAVTLFIIAGCSSASAPYDASTDHARSIKSAGTPGVYAALGASVTAGQAASAVYTPRSPVPVPVVTSPAAQNFAVLVANQIGAAPLYRVTAFQDLGIPGAGVMKVASVEVPMISPQASAISIFVGADDLATVSRYTGGIQAGVNWWKSQFDGIISILRLQHPFASIVIANLPNYPVARGYYSADNSFAVQAMDTQVINPYASKGITVIDLMCSHFIQGISPTVRWWYNGYYHAVVDGTYDWKHPNDAGHAQLARDIAAGIAAPTMPLTDCPPYLCHSAGLNPDSDTICT